MRNADDCDNNVKNLQRLFFLTFNSQLSFLLVGKNQKEFFQEVSSLEEAHAEREKKTSLKKFS